MARGDLTDGVVAYWTMDETSGNRADSIGGHTLTDNNTVTSGTGLFGNAALFTAANSEYLSAADAAGLRIAGDFSISMWIKPVVVGSAILASKRASGQAGWLLHCVYNPALPADSNTLFAFGGYNAAGSFSSGSKFAGLATGVWTHIVGLYKTDSPAAFRVIINGVDDQVTAPFATSLIDPAGGTAPLHLGASNTPDSYFDGYMEQVIIWNRMISAQNATDLYNGGVGLPYPWDVGPQTFRRIRGFR